MKKIQTAINNNIGNQDNNTPKIEGIFSSIGTAEMLTPLFDNFSIKLGSFGEYVINFSPLDNTPLMLLPCISTCTTLPLSTSDKNSENIILFFWEIEPCGF